VTRILIAGIGGASLGTEIAKSLRLCGGYSLLGCDISALAYGRYSQVFDSTFVVQRDRYIEHVLEICISEKVAVLIPGAEEPTRLISGARERFIERGVHLGLNTAGVVAQLSNKRRCFALLHERGLRVPATVSLDSPSALERVNFPCIIKPAENSGGSAFVFFARSKKDGEHYAQYLSAQNMHPIAQDYVPHDKGEFTVGVLSAPDRRIVGSIALKRAFPSKLSIQSQGADFLISSGISQGHIGPYRDVCSVAEEIARAVESAGPLNVQGRVDQSGQFVPFEINPRFSASTYLRALAGFNEVDRFVKLLLGRETQSPIVVKSGWYLRSLTELFVADGQVPQ